MFKFIKRHALAISLTIGALLAAGLGCAYFLPAQTAAVIASVGGFFSKIGSKIAGWFGKTAATATETPPVDVTVEPAPAAA